MNIVITNLVPEDLRLLADDLEDRGFAQITADNGTVVEFFTNA